MRSICSHTVDYLYKKVCSFCMMFSQPKRRTTQESRNVKVAVKCDQGCQNMPRGHAWQPVIGSIPPMLTRRKLQHLLQWRLQPCSDPNAFNVICETQLRQFT